MDESQLDRRDRRLLFIGRVLSIVLFLSLGIIVVAWAIGVVSEERPVPIWVLPLLLTLVIAIAFLIPTERRILERSRKARLR